MKTIVLSGINITVGGTLSIYKNFLDEIVKRKIYEKYKIVAMVSQKKLFEKYINKIEIIEFPKCIHNRLKRYYYEYVGFKKYSKSKDIFLWLSLNDQTPNVKADFRVLYYHNPSSYYKTTFFDFLYDKWFFFDAKLYKYLVKINLKKNDYICVQQKWIADKFLKYIPRENLILFSPEKSSTINHRNDNIKINNKVTTFFYPAGSRIYKNFEVILKAVKILNQEKNKFKVIITINGKENKYTKYLFKKYGQEKNVIWSGFLSAEEMQVNYQNTDCLIFPSKLETWGLPISESKQYEIPIIVADLPYAHETVGNYDKVCFFDPNAEKKLAMFMKKIITKEYDFLQEHNYKKNEDYKEIISLEELLNLIT